MDSAKKQLADRLKSANNILVTVSRSPSVDQLAAMLGLSLLLDKMGKHAAAVYSGDTPSTIEFLEPEEVIEKNPDSLRDFIIALDKSKADKLRYKVEDNVVRIFITPYKTSISQEDFEFSQGDFNVDVVVALGVNKQEELDESILNHGRILHDATVASLTVLPEDGALGSINWHDPQASSLSELVAELAQELGSELLDKQIATALLTGVVAETERFSNANTTSQTMSVSAALMAAGADQQLVATKLDEGPEAPPVDPPPAPPNNGGTPSTNDNGSIAIDHDAEDSGANFELPPPQPDAPVDDASIDMEPESPAPPENPEPSPPEGADAQTGGLSSGSKLVTEPPSLGGTLTANTQPEGLDPSVDPMSAPPAATPGLIGHDAPPVSVGEMSEPESPAPPADTDTAMETDDLPLAPAPEPPLVLSSISPSTSPNTLTDLEQAVHSPHVDGQPDETDMSAMRDEVNRALQSSSSTPPPVTSLGSQPFGGDLHPSEETSPQVTDSTAPPPVPPPIPFQFGGNPPENQ